MDSDEVSTIDLDQWADIFSHMAFCYRCLHQFEISDITWFAFPLVRYLYLVWLLFDRGSFRVWSYQTKPVSMHMEPKRLYTSHWTNTSRPASNTISAISSSYHVPVSVRFAEEDTNLCTAQRPK